MAPFPDAEEQGATLPPHFGPETNGSRAQIGGRPAQRMSEDARKIVLALYGALDLKISQHVRDGIFHGETCLGVLDEFREIVQCFDIEHSLLLTPDNTKSAMKGGS